MRDYMQFYIDGQWIDPVNPSPLEVINPADGSVAGHINVGSAADVDKAVSAAARAFNIWSQTSREERLALLDRIITVYERRIPEVGDAIMTEMGAPLWLARGTQAGVGALHFKTARKILENFEFEQDMDANRIVREPIGVCAFITPWNWPIHQICAKVAPALATGCTIVLKPSEIAPFSGQLFAEILAEAGVPAGVFNLVQGEGPVVGQALAEHPQVDMISITGSTRAGILVAQAAAKTVKRVCQELGGKSPNIILEDADFAAAVTGGINGVMMNSGQSCRAPTRMLVPNKYMSEVLALAKEAAESWPAGNPSDDARMGPVISQSQWVKIQDLIQSGLDEGATLVTGGLGKPEGLEQGYYVKPTVFANVKNSMRISREEIFGPVLCILGYDTEDEAIAIANDTEYGLGGYVHSKNIEHARLIARRIRAGYISLNNAGLDLNVPFGGYKHSGNGREFGSQAFGEFLEYKSVLGFASVS